MAGGSAPNNNGLLDGPEMGFLLGGAAIALAVYMVYSSHHALINTVLSSGNRALLLPFTFFFDDAAKVYRVLGTKDPATYTWSNVQAQLAFTGRYLLFVFIPLFAWLAFYTARQGLGPSYSEVMSAKTLLKKQTKNYPYMTPIVALELEKRPVHEGTWRMHRKVIQWVVDHQLLLGPDGKPLDCAKAGILAKSGLPNEAARYDRAGVTFNEEKARQLFAEQLGGRWPGHLWDWSGLDKLQRGIAAAYIAFGFMEKERGQDLLNRMAVSITEPLVRFSDGEGTLSELMQALDITDADAILAQYGRHPDLQQYLGPHVAWVNVRFYRLRQFSQERGLLENAYLRWMRPVHRTLFYTLLRAPGPRSNTLPVTEAGGVQAHLEAERMLGFTLETPEVETAIRGAHNQLYKEGWIDIPPPGYVK